MVETSSSIASMSSTSLLPPPSYSPSTTSPSYAVEPRDGERRLELVTRTRPSTPSAKFTTKTRGITVALHEQEAGATAPTYARNAIIKGDIEVSDNVHSVAVKLEGRQALTLSDASYTQHLLFSEEHVLWERRDSSSSCPTRHTFHVPFPTHYTTEAGNFLCPPTCDVNYAGSQSLAGRISYSIVVDIKKAVVGSWKKHKTVSIPIHYYPRSRPYLPISPSLFPFLSSLKTRPEDWHQVTTKILDKKNAATAIDCHLFVPSVQIYALSDTIPFHLQLKGPSDTLRKFMGLAESAGSLPTRVTTRSTDTSTSTSSRSLRSAVRTAGSVVLGSLSDALSSHAAHSTQKASIRVYLFRQTSVKVHGQKAWKNTVIGEGTLRPIEHPPSWSSATAYPWSVDHEEELVLDWEGEVKADEDVKLPSLLAGDLRVMDFMAVKLLPARPESSSVPSHEHMHPIRLVTDRYCDTYSHPSDI